MLFVTHLAAAAVIGRRPGLPTAPLLVGAAAPDLVDKPLGAAGVTELYHSVGHSALALAALLAVALYSRTGAPLAPAPPATAAVAVAAGWASHLLLDAVHVVLNGRPGHALFLLWPLARSSDPLGLPPVAFVRHYVGTPSFYLEIVLWLALIGLFVRGRRRDAPTAGD